MTERKWRQVSKDNIKKRHSTYGMARLQCKYCNKYFYTYDRQQVLCTKCRKNPELSLNHEKLFSQDREKVLAMTDEEYQQLLGEVPF